MITWKTLVLIAAVGLMTPIASYAAPLLPGDQTDPTASTGRPTATSRGHEPEEPYRYPYISTYYVEPTVKAGDEVVVDYYVTDWDQSEIRFADDSWKFDVMVAGHRADCRGSAEVQAPGGRVQAAGTGQEGRTEEGEAANAGGEEPARTRGSAEGAEGEGRAGQGR